MLATLLGGLSPSPAVARGEEAIGECEEGEQASGALYLFCVPKERHWNGDLVIYAHGYVAFNEPIHLPDLELPNGMSIPDLANSLGYAFATTSYSTNGLAVLAGIGDVLELVDLFGDKYGKPGIVYLVGASEGGIVTTLAVEQYPDVFQGGMALCGPVGDFRRQVNYWGDFRVVFDAFFPEMIPGSPVDIPPEVIESWDAVYEPGIAAAIADRPLATLQLLRVTGAPVDSDDPLSINETVLGILWYNVFATNDGAAKLDGQPFANKSRIYRGSANDLWLNRRVERFEADPAALAEIEEHYQTTGKLASTLVTLHTTGDPIIPYWHVRGYRRKVLANGSGSLYHHIPVVRYGHCNFKIQELLVGFALLVFKVTGQELTGVEDVLPDDEARQEFDRLAREHGAVH